MKNIKTTLKTSLLSKEDKKLVKAGLMNNDKEWSSEVRDFALDQLIEERLATKEFKDSMLVVADDRLEENN